jgi:hypothetical protein
MKSWGRKERRKCTPPRRPPLELGEKGALGTRERVKGRKAQGIGGG